MKSKQSRISWLIPVLELGPVSIHSLRRCVLVFWTPLKQWYADSYTLCIP